MSFSPTGDRFAAFRHSSYTRFFFARFLLSFSQQIVSVAVGWQMYDQTGKAIYLGLIGLVQFLPSLLLILVTGSVADRHNRRAIAALCSLVSALCTLALLIMTATETFAPWPVFAVLLIFGIERAFMSPAVQSLAPNLVPEHALSNAIAWNSSSWQLAAITGPVIGGLLYGVSATTAYTVAVIFSILGAALLFMIPKPEQKTTGEAKSWAMILGGFSFIRAEKVVLGAISLDLFAVLLGGATALMPIFARDILTLGPWGLGLLRAAPGLGAIVMAIFLAAYPLKHRAGLYMFIGVALFGVGTIIFGASTNTEISIAALALMGAADMVSVYVRESLIALWTPDQLRGRVNAVNMVFVGASNELGEFRAGTMASVFGAVPAVIIGGIGTLAVAAIWASSFPKLRRIDTLDAPA
ncbi:MULTISPECIES: MFS transporter [Rhizobium]|uniref:MFS transporter n=1 Tax=Rhizobium TaxID=379 RepID=UPI0007EA022E|nr:MULTISPECIES: MFS transporter [Rhizobium]ANK87556.1 major facilitator superfamily protein [Rhizobium sp. N731]ANK93501.1 major facilitator superfamily protein [Rhizobium sp. N6212]ANK99547.1 major facilitator superfamily protein [Rhizobium sp. N621]ANL05677.1 major facilitator superfamily protein [Rhizobium esperanzae]ANL11731.1 major facilitator superfamily protein [Rhizobium sp. N1341]